MMRLSSFVPPELTGQSVVDEPELQLRLLRILGDGSWGLEPGSKRRPTNGFTKDLWTRWLERGALILPAVITMATPPRVVAIRLVMLIVVSNTPVEAVVDPLGLTIVPEAITHRGCPLWWAWGGPRPPFRNERVPLGDSRWDPEVERLNFRPAGQRRILRAPEVRCGCSILRW